MVCLKAVFHNLVHFWIPWPIWSALFEDTYCKLAYEKQKLALREVSMTSLEVSSSLENLCVPLQYNCTGTKKAEHIFSLGVRLSHALFSVTDLLGVQKFVRIYFVNKTLNSPTSTVS